MKYELLYRPTFSAARVSLDPGETIRAESGAMVSMSPTITIESKAQGGIGKALGRLFAGESFFQTKFTATHGAGEVLLAPSSLGDVVGVNLNLGRALMLTSGCFLACDESLQIETKIQGKGFFAGEGLFLMRVSGTGTILVSCFGASHAVQLAEGQPYIVDTGHIVAFEESCQYSVRTVTKGLIQSFTSGEGYVAEFVGPGIVYIQTRSPQSFGPWISQYVPRGS
ncbi:MAG: TIGR00266 family protein [Fimbriimonadaceae bacterium]